MESKNYLYIDNTVFDVSHYLKKKKGDFSDERFYYISINSTGINISKSNRSCRPFN